MTYLGNAFSLQMLDLRIQQEIRVTPVSLEEVSSSGFVSVVGHPDTAAVLTGLLGVEVPFNRTSVSLTAGDILYVGQVVGGRLPEGATTLPEGFSLTFVKVEV